MKAPASLEAVRDNGAGLTYPRDVLLRCETALVLFAAGFFGKQDAYWVAEAGINATCVDLDVERLRAMAKIYPGDWEFKHAEAFEYAAVTERQWDLVSIDCPTGAFKRCAGMIERWCLLAERVVVLGTSPDIDITAPVGWQLTERRHRSTFKGGVEWAVLERP